MSRVQALYKCLATILRAMYLAARASAKALPLSLSSPWCLPSIGSHYVLAQDGAGMRGPALRVSWVLHRLLLRRLRLILFA